MVDQETQFSYDHYTVHKAAKLGTDPPELYRIKIIKLKNLEEYEIKAIQSEVKALEQIYHPNIIKLFDVFLSPDGNYLYMVFEHMAGGTLEDKINDMLEQGGAFSEDEIFNIISPIVEGMEYCHEIGVIHRNLDVACADLQPENILYENKDDPNSVLKVSEFGFARHFVRSEKFNTQAPPLFYRSPEMLDQKGYDFKTDCWAVGVTLFFLLTGHYPFDFEIPSEDLILAQMKEGVIYASEEWEPRTKEVKVLTEHLLQLDPQQRYSMTQIKESEWYLRF